ncbi:hypothetical protein N7528_003690 [Penicillium herquei]|nr:hypothetical protein N7528_003690 [Penicillium herquei]
MALVPTSLSSLTHPFSVEGEISFNKIREMVESRPENQRYEAQVEIMQQLLKLRDENNESISQWYSYVLESENWKGSLSKAGFDAEWKKAAKLHGKHLENLVYIESIRQRAMARWGKECTNTLFTRITTRSLAEQVSKVLGKDIAYDDLISGVNREVYDRLSRPGRGHRRQKFMIQGDLVRAANQLRPNSLSREELKKHDLKLDGDGFVVGKLPSDADMDEDENIHSDADANSDLDDIEDDDFNISQSSDDESYLDDSGDDSSTHADTKSNRGGDDTDSEENPSDNPKKRKKRRQARWSGVLDDRKGKRSKKSCNCQVPQSMIKIFNPKPGPEDVDSRDRLILLRKIQRKISSYSAEKLCFEHTKTLARYLGLYTRQFTHADLISRLNYATKQIGDWDSFIKAKSSWFTPANVPEFSDRSSYRFEIDQPPIPRIQEYARNGFSLENILTRIYGTADHEFQSRLQDFDMTGNVVLPKLFGWLEDDISQMDGVSQLSRVLNTEIRSLLQLIHIEFNLYDYHYTPAVSRPRMGWNRSMFHSLTQQLVRQDICYYAAYVAIRPDHAWRLISFPYYTKSAYPGEDTAFVHIDLSIGDCIATGRGANAVQGSVSFTDEDKENCSVVLPGIHKHLERWWEIISTSSKSQVSGHTVAVYPWMFDDRCRQEFGIDFARSICLTGDVRLTLPCVPHGSVGPATRLRRTVMPWFGAIQDDHNRLETAEAGPWSSISDAHRDLCLAPKIPSGSTCHVYAVNPYSFPGLAQLTGLGPISDALVGRIKWTEWSVVSELETLFGESTLEAHEFIRRWRSRAARQFIEAFANVISAEKLAYREDSYFYLREHGLPIPDVHLSYRKDLGDRETIEKVAAMPEYTPRGSTEVSSDAESNADSATSLPPVSDLFVDQSAVVPSGHH